MRSAYRLGGFVGLCVVAACAEAEPSITVWPGETILVSDELVLAWENCSWTTLDDSCDPVREIAATGDQAARFLMVREEMARPTQDYSRTLRAIETMEVLAEEGYPPAQAVVGNTLLFHGRDARPPTNQPGQGLVYLRNAYDAGSAMASYSLGNAFLDGVGVERSIEQAMQYFQVAADRGHVVAGYEFSVRALDGRFGEYPMATIRQYILTSAELDYFHAIDGICNNAFQWYNGLELELETLNAPMFTQEERANWCSRRAEIQAAQGGSTAHQ